MMRSKYPTLILGLVLLSLISNTLASKLVLIQALTRHGARYPIYVDHSDGSDYAKEQNSIGELTTQGKNMHYLLGKKLYSEYWQNLFGNTPFENRYNQSKFYIKSSDINRTIESAQSQLMGIL